MTKDGLDEKELSEAFQALTAPSIEAWKLFWTIDADQQREMRNMLASFAAMIVTHHRHLFREAPVASPVAGLRDNELRQGVTGDRPADPQASHAVSAPAVLADAGERPAPDFPSASPVAGASRWQPIETAPKDGTEVLVAAPGRHGQQPRLYVSAARYYDGEGWYEVNNDPTDVWGGALHPTYWQPLPPAPASEER